MRRRENCAQHVQLCVAVSVAHSGRVLIEFLSNSSSSFYWPDALRVFSFRFKMFVSRLWWNDGAYLTLNHVLNRISVTSFSLSRKNSTTSYLHRFPISTIHGLIRSIVNYAEMAGPGRRRGEEVRFLPECRLLNVIFVLFILFTARLFHQDR